MRKHDRKDLSQMIKINTLSNRTHGHRVPPIGWNEHSLCDILVQKMHDMALSWENTGQTPAEGIC